MKEHSYLGKRRRLVQLAFALTLSVMMAFAPITAFADEEVDDGASVPVATASPTADPTDEGLADPIEVTPDEISDGGRSSAPGTPDENDAAVEVPELIAPPTEVPTAEIPVEVDDPVTLQEPTAAPEAETNGVKPAGWRWESEPNNSVARANYLPLGDTMQGSASTKDSWQSDNDYYRFEVPSNGRLTVDFTYPNRGAGDAYYVRILNASGEEVYGFDLGGVDGDGKYVKNYSMFVGQGTWYIKIDAHSSWASWGATYNLTITHQAGLVETEFNNSTAKANLLTLGKTLQGSASTKDSWQSDNDYYRFEVPSNGRLTVDFTYPNRGAGDAYYVRILNASGEEVYGFDLGGVDGDGKYVKNYSMFVGQGTWYIKIDAHSSWASWGATYNLTITHQAGLVETEFNNSTAKANLLTLGKTLQGSASTKDSWQSDNDYYRFEVPSNGRLTVDFTYPKNLGTETLYKLDVLNGRGERAYSYELRPDQANGSWLRNQSMSFAKGTWYIKIDAHSSWASWGKTYNLTVSKPKFTGWKQVGSDWYYVINGKNATGWTPVNGVWYYMNSKGAMQTGWLNDGGTWYYLKSSGAMTTGWTPVGGTWYYMAASGAMKTGWVQTGGAWYYLNASGAMHTGWLQQGKTWYYLKPGGAMVTGNYVINGKVNRFSSSGAWLG